jgi:hypothetical protein
VLPPIVLQQTEIFITMDLTLTHNDGHLLVISHSLPALAWHLSPNFRQHLHLTERREVTVTHFLWKHTTLTYTIRTLFYLKTSHHSSLKEFHLTRENAAFAAIPICRESSTLILVQYMAVNITFSAFKKVLVTCPFSSPPRVTSNKHVINFKSKLHKQADEKWPAAVVR